MQNEELISELSREINRCDSEIKKAETEIERLKVTIGCLSDKKILLYSLLKKAEREV